MHRTTHRRSRIVAVCAALAVMAATLSAPTAALAAPVEPISALATLTKEASTSTVQPGETFSYTITVGCSSITDTGCRGAVLTDAVPAEFELLGAQVGGISAADPVMAGQNLTVTFDAPLGDGTVGIVDATTGVVTVTVRARADLPFEASGVAVFNDASLSGANFETVQAQAGVEPIVPLDLAVTAAKTLSPTSGIGVPGTPVTATLSATNDSNAIVDTLSLTDPADVGVAPNPFEYLGFSGFGPVTPPVGSTGPPLYEVYADGAWVGAPGGALPGGVDPADVRGTRVTFFGSFAPGSTGSLQLDLVHSDLVTGAPNATVVQNTVRGEVSLGGEAAAADASAGYTLQQNAVQVTASKEFDPALVVAGEDARLTVGATNASALSLETLSLREPSAGFLDPALTFAGIDGPVAYPAGATAGTVTYQYIDGGSDTLPFASGTTPPAPPRALAEVGALLFEFSGAILPGGTTSIDLVLETDPDQTGLPLGVPNEVLTTGVNAGVTGTGPAADTLYIFDEQVQTYVGKQIRPPTILAVPGERVTVSLTGGTLGLPEPPDPAGTTVATEQIVIQDPIDPAATPTDPWWNAFDATSITQTPIPDGATLSVDYWDVDAGAWVPLPGAQGIAGPQIWSFPIPDGLRDDIGGLRFVYTDPAGFPPGTDLAPNFTSELRTDARDGSGPAFDSLAGGEIENCAASSASIDAGGPVAAASDLVDCPSVTLVPVDPGTADFIDKGFLTSSSGGDKSVIARSGDTIPARLSWSTGGYSNIDSLQITDVADPAGTPISQSVFDAFNVTRIQPITPSTDPLIVYDAVSDVDLFIDGAWVAAANDPCPASCVGQFPGMNLTATEQGLATGVRLTFVENPNRAAVIAGDLDAPTVGSGVARSFANTRPIDVVFQVRDLRRDPANPGPVLGSGLYNVGGSNGTVRNTVDATAFPASGAPLSAQDADEVIIIDVPLTIRTDKGWRGGPLGVPELGVPENSYPLSTISITARNTTPARVDTLSIRDPAPGSPADPFDSFRFNRFATISVPSGATATVVTVFLADGSSQTFTRTQALALTASSFVEDVIGVQVTHSGRIAAAASTTLDIEVRLRAFHRDGSGRVTEADSPIPNVAIGTITDLGGLGGSIATANGTSTIVLEEPTFTVTADKSISPPTQTEPDDGVVTATVTGQPGGSTNAVSMTLTDDDPSFWNAFDYVGLAPSFTLSAPIERVQIDYLAGGTFTAGGPDGITVTGATWTNGTPLDLAAARTYAASLPAGLHGLRFTFTKANGADWFNPSYPVQAVPIQLERRDDLRSGDPVPTTRANQVPAPGETQAGFFTNTVVADGVSDVIGVGGGFLTATDSQDAVYRYLHSDNSVAVLKSPTGVVRPGVVIPFTLAFTNSGQTPILDPVFTDVIPLDAGGAQLIFDPDRDPSVSPYTFALAGAAPGVPNGDPLPTDSDDMIASVAPDGSSIRFVPPLGSALEIGQTYTITIDLMLRPGLTPADLVTNTAVIRGDQPFDDCSTTLSPDGFECSDQTTVSPLSVPALSTRKYVKAATPHSEPGIPQVISTSNDFDCTDAADALDFYRSPCVPVTLPGDEEIWRFVVTNTGTLPIDTVVAMDHLPTPNDTGLIVVNPRGSVWPAQFSGGVELVPSATTPAGTALTTYYSTSDTTCTADLNPIVSACALGAWLPLTPAIDPTTVRSLKFVVDFPDADLFAPGETLDIQFRTRTMPQTIAPTRVPIAWNTVAAGGAALQGAQRVVVPTTEGRRVGVTYPTGPVRLQKIVSGAGAAFAPATYPVQLVCESAGEPLEDLPAVTLVRGGPPVVVPLLPWGAECTALEADLGQSAQIIGTATVGGPSDDIGVVTVENVFAIGDLTISKSVDSTAVDAEGVPIEYGPFTFAVACTFLGSPVYATGYDAATPMEQTLETGESWSLAGLPAGAECTVTETDAAGAASTSFVVTQAGVPSPPVAGSTVVVEIAPTGSVEAEAVNTFAVGSLQLSKVVTGAGAADLGTGPFVLHVTCTLGADIVWDADVVLGGDEPLATTIDDIAAGASCVVTEPDAGGANAVAIDGSPALVGADATATVTVTNDFAAGALTVTKTVTGPGAALYGTGPFEVSLECTRIAPDGPTPVAVPGGATRDLTAANGYTATYDPLLVGSSCTLTETGDGGATTTDIDGAGASATIDVVLGGQSVEIVNTFAVGSIDVVKTVSGADAASHTSAVFEIAVSCIRDVDGAESVVAIPGGATRALSVGATTTIADLPVGAVCTVQETSTGGADAVAMSPSPFGQPDRAVVVVGAVAPASVTVDNRFDPPLPPTGVDGASAYALLALAALLLGLGVVLVVRRRRRS